MKTLTSGQIRAVLEELPVPAEGTQLATAITKLRESLIQSRSHNQRRIERRKLKEQATQ